MRDRRLDQGVRQADLAKAVGISPSYLNLIEHNKRRIAGTLLADIARTLDVTAAQLTDGADRSVLDLMLEAAAGSGIAAETDKVAEMAARYPGWANVIAHQAQDRAALQVRVQELTDRMTHDPALSTALHAVISSVTSIRSTASILTSDETLDADWVSRFHRNIHDDARRLADSSSALIRFLDAPDAQQDGALSPFAEVEHYIAQNWHDARAVRGDMKHPQLSVAATALLEAHIARSKALDKAMPVDAFAVAAKDAGYDPQALAQSLDVPLVDVMAQLAALPSGAGHPPIGLAVCDASGAITYLKQAADFTLPRGGLACPLWPVFTALGQAGRPVMRDVIMPDNAARPMRCWAIGEQRSDAGFDMPPVMRATMLVLTEPDRPDDRPLPLGPSCRICPRPNCPARREPSVMVRDPL